MNRPSLSPDGTPVIWWIATSSKKQKMSPLGQLRWCRQISAEHGFYPVAILRVPGHSRQYIEYAEAARDLPAYRRLLEVLPALKPRFVLCVSRDRLGREALAVQVEAYCERHGCKVWSGRTGRPVESNVGQVYAAGFETTMSRASTRQFVEDRLRSMRRRVVEKRLPYTHVEYGYRIVRDEAGHSVGVDLDPERAETRRWIDRQFMAGAAPHEIAVSLNARGVKPMRGAMWRSNAIQLLLHSRFPSGSIQVRLNGEALLVEGVQPRLRTPEQQAEIDRRFRLRRRGSQRGTYGLNPWYGVAYCADCGARMVRQRNENGLFYHGCGRFRQMRDAGRPECSPHFTPDSMLVEALAAFFQDIGSQEVDVTDRTAELAEARARLKLVQAQKRQAARDKIKYGQAAGDFEAVLGELVEAERAVEKEIARLQSETAGRATRAEVEATMRLLSGMDVRAWLASEDPAEVRRTLAGIVRLECPQRPPRQKEPKPHVRLAV